MGPCLPRLSRTSKPRVYLAPASFPRDSTWRVPLITDTAALKESSLSVVLKYHGFVKNSPEGLLKHRLLALILRVSESAGLGWGLKICISNKFLGDTAFGLERVVFRLYTRHFWSGIVTSLETEEFNLNWRDERDSGLRVGWVQSFDKTSTSYIRRELFILEY